MDFRDILKFRVLSALILIIKLLTNNTFAQSINNNDIIYNDINEKITNLNSYDFIHYPLINGKKYNKYYYGIKGHQFFDSQNFCEGEIIIKDKKYTDLLIRYDIYNDIVNLSSNAGNELVNIELNKNIITGFYIDDHLFIKYDFPESSGIDEYNGFYEMVYNGKIKVAFKWVKYICNSQDIYSGEFITERTVYIINNNQFSKIKNRRDILSLFKDKEHKIKKFLRSNKFIAKKANASEYIELIKFYEN